MKLLFIPFIIFSIVAVGIPAAPGGAPDDACEGLLPFHNLTGPQNTSVPYELVVSVEQANITWTLNVRPLDGVTPFKGVIIQARPASSPEAFQTFGFFSRYLSTNTHFRPISCLTTDDTATHTNNTEKIEFPVRWFNTSPRPARIVFR